MLFTLITFILVCIGVGILRYSLWRNECSKHMPGKTPGLFNILGDGKDFLVFYDPPGSNLLQKNFLYQLRRRTEEYKKQKLFCVWAGYMPFVVIFQYDAVKELTEKKILKKNFTYKWMEPLIGTGLLSCKVSKWRTRRKLLMPCFSSGILRGFFPVFNEHAQKLVDFLHEETKKEFTYIEKPITLLALDIICETMFGVKIGALENDRSHSQYVRSFRKIFESFMIRTYNVWYWPNLIFNLSKDGREMKRHQQILHDFTKNIIRERKELYLSGHMEQVRGKRKALLDRLLEMHIETGELSEEDIREEVNTFAVAGHETVSTSIVWALYLIGLHCDVQEKIHEELDKVFGEDTKRPVTEKDLSELLYLDCVLKETMRVYPTAPWFGRLITEDTSICGHILPKGTPCVVMTYFMHKDEDVFPDPEKFDPERFSPENSLKIPEYAYVPFSAGPRNCIGKSFAEMELKVILSSILRTFSVESLDTRDKVKPLLLVTLHSSLPIRIRIRPRIIKK